MQLPIRANATEVLLLITVTAQYTALRWIPADLAVLALLHTQTWRVQVVEHTLFCTAKGFTVAGTGC